MKTGRITHYQGSLMVTLSVTSKSGRETYPFSFGIKKALVIAHFMPAIKAFAAMTTEPITLPLGVTMTEWRGEDILNLPMLGGDLSFGKSKAKAIAENEALIQEFVEGTDLNVHNLIDSVALRMAPAAQEIDKIAATAITREALVAELVKLAADESAFTKLLADVAAARWQ